MTQSSLVHYSVLTLSTHLIYEKHNRLIYEIDGHSPGIERIPSWGGSFILLDLKSVTEIQLEQKLYSNTGKFSRIWTFLQ